MRLIKFQRRAVCILVLVACGATSLLAQRDAAIIEAAQSVPGAADEFKKQFKKELKRSILRKDKDLRKQLTKRSSELANQLQRFSKRFLKGDDAKARGDLDYAMTMAFDVNRTMAEHRFSEAFGNSWRDLRSQLNALARHYDLDPLEG
jgi:hypothetical protein